MLEKSDKRDKNEVQSNGLALAELISYIEDISQHKVSKLADLITIYVNQLSQLGVATNKKSINSTIFENKLLSYIPQLKAQNSGRDVILVTDNDMQSIVGEAMKRNFENEAHYFTKSPKSIRNDLFNQEYNGFEGSFDSNSLHKSVPKSLLHLIK